MAYLKQGNPFVVPTTDGKLIEEHLGVATTLDKNISVAHMIAPPGWSEPFQNLPIPKYNCTAISCIPISLTYPCAALFNSFILLHIVVTGSYN
jgi:hypothetical protein